MQTTKVSAMFLSLSLSLFLITSPSLFSLLRDGQCHLTQLLSGQYDYGLPTLQPPFCLVGTQNTVI